MDSFGQLLYLKAIPDSVYHLVRLFDLWGVRGVLPYFDGRIYWPLLAAALFLAWRSHRRGELRGSLGRCLARSRDFLRRVPFVAFMLSMVAAIALIYVVMRMNVRGTSYAREAPFYPYPVWAFLFLALAGILRELTASGRYRVKLLHVALLTVLVILPNAVGSWANTQDFARRFPPPQTTTQP